MSRRRCPSISVSFPLFRFDRYAMTAPATPTLSTIAARMSRCSRLCARQFFGFSERSPALWNSRPLIRIFGLTGMDLLADQIPTLGGDAPRENQVVVVVA